MNKPTIIYVMGVSGSGKSTIGNALSTALSYPFFDGDDYHPEANIRKMSSGVPLNDTDRQEWLQTLNSLAIASAGTGAVIVCSALKQRYREVLRKNLQQYTFVYLKGTVAEISERLSSRAGHFMPEKLLTSQFDALEEPTDAIEISILKSPEAIVKEVLNMLS